MTSTVPADKNEERRRRTLCKGKLLVSAGHVRDAEELRTKQGQSSIFQARIIRQTSVTLTPYKMLLEVLLGPLPAGFLQADGTMDAVDADYQAALALQQQFCGAQMPPPGPPLTARLSVTIAQAKLVKNYGLTRMDPYVRLRVGHCIYETHTDPSGGKTPRWQKVIHCLLQPGVNSVYLEIFDECSFTMDELIAWAHITIPPAVFNGETIEDWYPLNGKQGDGVEGMINLVMSYSVGPATVSAFPPMVMVPSTGLGYAAMPVYQAPPQPQPVPQHQQPPITAEQLQQIEEMFPSIDKEVIKSVLEANRGNNDATINSLLQMSE